MHSSYVMPVAQTQGNERVSFISVVNFVLRNLAFLLLGGVLFAIFAAIPTATAPGTYTATTSFITEGEPAPGGMLGLGLPGGGTGRGPEFYLELVRSPAILGPLVEAAYEAEPGKPAISLVERYGGSPSTPRARETAIGAVLGRMAIKTSVNGVITLRVTAEHPRLAAEVAQGFLDQIDEFNNNRRRLQTSAERRFAAQRLREIEVEVRTAEDQLRNFLERNREVARSPALTFERDRLVEQLSMRRALYGSVLQGYERAKMDEVRDSPQATVIAPPTPPLDPDARSTTRNAVLGFFLGVLVAGFLAVTKEYFERIPQQSSPEASEFRTLRANWFAPIRQAVRTLLAAVRRSRQPESN